MALDNQLLRRWAAGGKQTDISGDELEDDSMSVESEEGEEEFGEAEQNLLWKGELPPEEVDEETAAEFGAWLQEHEPEFHDVLMELAGAYVAGDDRMIDHGNKELMMVEQYLVPEYPEFTPEEREALARAIESQVSVMGELGDAGEDALLLAVANAVAEVRAGGDEEEPEEMEETEEIMEEDQVPSGLTA